MYFAKTPEAVKPFTAGLVWNFSRTEKSIYLTFDDGPTPGVTESVLEILAEYNARATFFCLGGNVKAHPELYLSICSSGHSVGNHTWNHMNGWKFGNFSYYRNIQECSELVHSKLFRPPYGRITIPQVRALRKRYSIIMWDVISGDWKQDLSHEKCLLNVISNGREGSIVVFHDSLKAEKNLLFALPRTLRHYADKGYSFKAIPQSYAT